MSKAARIVFLSLGSLLVLCLFYVAYQTMLVPIFLGAFFAYLFLPVVDWIDDRVPISRFNISASVIFAILFLAVAALLGLVPYLYQEIIRLVRKVPDAYGTIVAEWVPYLESLTSSLGLSFNFRELVSGIGGMDQMSKNFQGAIEAIWFTAPKLISTVVTIFLVPLIAFVLLQNARTYKAFLKKHIPLDMRSVLAGYVTEVDQTLRAVVKGQIMVASILAVLYMLGLSVVGLSGAIAIGLVAGLCRVVPYLDVVVGAALSLIAIFSDFNGDWGVLFGVFLVFLTVQIIDGTFVTPRVIGERVGLHPVVVIVSILAFGELVGFKGILLAIPVVAATKVTLSWLSKWYLHSPYFGADKLTKLKE